jgi:hypothetical protein
MLAYIDDEHYRRRILTQLNRGESRHSVARAVFHGQRGELRQRYREGQEDQLGALGLVVNAIVLWNTIYMEAALQQLRDEGVEVRDEDSARLSPLVHRHINFQGRYSFALTESVARGELRPLRNPYDISEDEEWQTRLALVSVPLLLTVLYQAVLSLQTRPSLRRRARRAVFVPGQKIWPCASSVVWELE